MHDTKERLSLFWIFALLNYLYADVVILKLCAPRSSSGRLGLGQGLKLSARRN